MDTRRTETHVGMPVPELFERNAEGRRAAIRRVLAVMTLVGAPLAGALGVLLGLDAYLTELPFVAYAANALLLAVIPLLLLGAHMLDTLEDDIRRSREESRAVKTAERSHLRIVGAGSNELLS